MKVGMGGGNKTPDGGNKTDKGGNKTDKGGTNISSKEPNQREQREPNAHEPRNNPARGKAQPTSTPRQQPTSTPRQQPTSTPRQQTNEELAEKTLNSKKLVNEKILGVTEKLIDYSQKYSELLIPEVSRTTVNPYFSPSTIKGIKVFGTGLKVLQVGLITNNVVNGKPEEAAKATLCLISGSMKPYGLLLGTICSITVMAYDVYLKSVKK